MATCAVTSWDFLRAKLAFRSDEVRAIQLNVGTGNYAKTSILAALTDRRVQFGVTVKPLKFYPLLAAER